MNSENKNKKKTDREFRLRIENKQTRKMKSRSEKSEKSLWFGLGMFGLVGWSVAIPVLIFLAIGIWIDSVYPGKISWTLIFLFIGVVLGCLAWFWVKRESGHE